MKKILDSVLLDRYFKQYEIEKLFDVAISNVAQLHLYGKDELILHAQTKLEYYYLLVDGKVRVSYLFENGKAMLLKFYKPFHALGDIELLGDKPIRCNVEATEDTVLIAIPVGVLRNQYSGNLNFLHHLIQSLSEKLDATINNSSYNAVYPLVNRLASYLDEHRDAQKVVLQTSFKDLALFFSTTYRHLSRTFNELEESGVIRSDGKTIYILDGDKLSELSKNEYIITF